MRFRPVLVASSASSLEPEEDTDECTHFHGPPRGGLAVATAISPPRRDRLRGAPERRGNPRLASEKSSGQLRVIDPTSDSCKSQESRAGLERHRPHRLAGAGRAAGPQGPAGAEKGDKGDPGAGGAGVRRGSQGRCRYPGAAGPTGAKGDPGAAGAPGAKGDAGIRGPAGPTGPKGDPGAAVPATPQYFARLDADGTVLASSDTVLHNPSFTGKFTFPGRWASTRSSSTGASATVSRWPRCTRASSTRRRQGSRRFPSAARHRPPSRSSTPAAPG